MKRILAIVSAIILSASLTAFATPDEEMLADLKSLEIMVGDDDGNMRLEDTITRAEAAKMICAVQGITPDSLETNLEGSVFEDVADSHWAKGYINAVWRMGAAVGDEKGCFNPEAEITNEEIIKMLVNILGYEEMATQFGGYPTGYTRVAQRLGITKNLMLEVDGAAIRGDVASMFATALDTPLMIQSGWSADGTTSYVVYDGLNGVELRTLRTEYFGDMSR